MSKKELMTRQMACNIIYGPGHPVAKSSTPRSHAHMKLHTGGKDGVRRPGKTLCDHTNGSWASKQERNARQAGYRSRADGNKRKG